MLTRDDLQQIGKILDERLDQKLTPIEKGLKENGTLLQKNGELLKEQSNILKQHSKQLRSLKKDQSLMLKMLDKEQMDQRKRLKRVEEGIGLSTF